MIKPVPPSLLAGANAETKKYQENWPPDVVAIAVSMTALAALYYLYRAALEFPSLGLDFMNIWCAAKLVLGGKVMVLFDLTNLHAAQTALFSKEFLQYYLQYVSRHLPATHELMVPYVWAYPPHALPWIAGFGLLSYPMALVVWLVLTYIPYAFAVAYKLPQPWHLGLLLLLAPASCENISMAYTGFLIAAFIIGGIRLLDRHPVMAGILFALLTFKPQFAILVPVALLAGRNWQALAAMVLTTLALIGLSVLLFGFDPWYGYLHVILPNQRLLIEAPMDSEKINMFLTITPFIAARFIGLPIFLAYGLAGACLIAVIAAIAYVFAHPEAKNLRAPVLLTAVFFATPYAFVTDMTILSAAVILMLAARGTRQLSPYEICLLAANWMLPVLAAFFNYAHLPIGIILIALLLARQLRWIAESRTYPSMDDKIVVN